MLSCLLNLKILVQNDIYFILAFAAFFRNHSNRKRQINTQSKHLNHSSNQRTNGPVNAHLISGHTVSTKTRRMGQGQPRVIIYIKFVDIESPMLHAKFQDHRTSGSGVDF